MHTLNEALAEYTPTVIAQMSKETMIDKGVSPESANLLREVFDLFKDSSKTETICCSQDVFDACRDMVPETHEHFRVILLNAKNDIIGKKFVEIGTINECRVNPSQVFSYALQNAAFRIILVHNHPGGDAAPSPSDLALTKRLKAGAEILGVDILDHIIVAGRGYASLRDLGVF